MAHSWNIKALGPKKPIPLLCPPDCFFPALALLLKTQAIARVQSPGQMSSSSSLSHALPVGPETCHQFQLFLSTIFNMQMTHVSLSGCLQPPHSLFSLLRIGPRKEHHAQMEQATQRSSLSQRQNTRSGESYSPVLLPLTSFYQ